MMHFRKLRLTTTTEQRFTLFRHAAVRCVVPVILLWPAFGAADTALIAVATNFGEAAEKLAADFAALSDHEIKLSSGSTGKLYAQITNAAPFDALLAADEERPRRLEESELAVPGSRFAYAFGRLVLWSANAELIGADGVPVLREAAFKSLAIANPLLAPYGAAAEETLRALGLWEALQSKIVTGENVGQAFALVATGNAELGIVALSSVMSPRNTQQGSRWNVPQNWYTPIRQDAVLLRHGSANAAAVAFLAYLQSDEARLTITSFGYGLE